MKKKRKKIGRKRESQGTGKEIELGEGEREIGSE